MTPAGLASRVATRFRHMAWRWSARAGQGHARRQRRLARVVAMPEPDRQIATDIAEHGIHVTTLDRLALADTDSLLAQAEDCMRELAHAEPGHARDGYDASFAVLADPGELVSNWPVLLLWGLQDRILDIVESYLGQPSHCLGVFARRDLADGTEHGTRRWHIDINDFRYLKIIVYLNDVDADGGPFQYLSDTCSRRLLRAGRPKSVDDARIAALGNPLWTSCEGPAGTVIMVDTARLYHRGRVPENERFTLFYSFASRHPSRPDLCAGVQFRPGLAKVTSPLTRRQTDTLDRPSERDR